MPIYLYILPHCFSTPFKIYIAKGCQNYDYGNKGILLKNMRNLCESGIYKNTLERFEQNSLNTQIYSL